jgi:hypothetical protein
MGAKESVGAMLPMLLLGDVFAVIYWHRKAQWKILRQIIPPAAAGIVLGWLVLRGIRLPIPVLFGGSAGIHWLIVPGISDPVLKRTLGGIVVGLVTLQVMRDYGALADRRVPHHWAFAWIMGGLAGVVTMLTNAAGPIVIIFLLAMDLDRFQFIGTIAWYFLLLNAFKVPFFVREEMINGASLLFNLKLAPVVLAGGVVGLFAPKYIPEKPFRWTIIVLAAAAGLKLLILG